MSEEKMSSKVWVQRSAYAALEAENQRLREALKEMCGYLENIDNPGAYAVASSAAGCAMYGRALAALEPQP